ncbi:hypothetical protein E5Q_01185 [Mixia osmundae IAM 14324]|uniref:Dolichol phosphate-mannose biosynthesis regulatory protein n=1 Tax=Mixia osmundae (strain CBS 9802 / IAM 14324 / JCM 22182 / KY 12970) TaxID=764103 RepID=G7DVC3_MIXOS|nr:hypothetical protein E5Q_01185 [Mixia osmundae IAM 14324]
MGAGDRLVGATLLITAIATFTYYTAWALFTPFFPDDHPIQQLFPARVWAIRIPLVLLIVGLSGAGAFVGLVLVRTGRKKAAQKEATKAA